MWSVVGTWPFSLQLTQKAADMLSGGAKALDALEAGVHLVESDPNVDSVGRGGYLNANGELELDAAIMDGDTLKMGCVAGVRGFEHPVSIARKVMEETIHSVLIGAGAEEFARKMGIPEVGNEYMITEAARKAWEDKKKEGHDTIGSVALDVHGSMGVAMSTSGANMKVPGRVGDTPIVGSGFYVESGVGGAAATGLGEDIMRTCLCIRAVEMMRAGMTPQQAADKTILTAHETIKKHGIRPDNMAIVCMNAAGESAASSNHQGFYYSHACEGQEPVLEPVTPVIDNGVYGGGALGFLESENMSEYYEVVDVAGSPRGKLRHCDELPSIGECRPAVAVWVVNSKGEYLISRRSPEIAHGGMWQTTEGGVIAGEDSRTAALREVREELGVEPEAKSGKLWKMYPWPIPGCEGRALYYTWIFRCDADIAQVRLQPGETCDAMWADRETIRAMVRRGEFVPYDYLDQLFAEN